jgi:hypothetical protein
MYKPVNAVTVIDTSDSMRQYGYVEMTKRDSEAFISYSLPGDGLGVVSFDVVARDTYKFQIVDDNYSQVTEASLAIQKLSFTGDGTAIGSGLQAADTMLKAKTGAPRSVILLTDGENNRGPSPLAVLPKYPVYTFGLGVLDLKAQKMLVDIAGETHGQYYPLSTLNRMMKAFNDVRAKENQVRCVVNHEATIEGHGDDVFLAKISGGSMLQIGVVWSDNSLSYTNSFRPSAQKIGIMLWDPNEQVSVIQPRIKGAGYVVFDIPSPQHGEWRVEVFSGKDSSIEVTCGVFELGANQQGAADLVVSAPASIRAGESLAVQAHVVENGERVQNLQVRAEVFQPTLSVSNALTTYKDEIEKVELAEEDSTPGVPEDRRRLAKLRAKLLPERDILAYRSYELILREGVESGYGASLEDTHQAGGYTIRVVASGVSPETGAAFQRTRLATVLVID